MKKNISKILLGIFILTICLSPLFVLAQNIEDPDTGGDEYENNAFVLVLKNIKKFLLSFGGVLAVLFIIAGALMIIAGGGDTKKLETGKSMITWAIIGLAIIFMAQAIITTVESVISPADSSNLNNITIG